MDPVPLDSNELYSIVSVMQDRIEDQLSWSWLNFREVFTDTLASTVSLGALTVIVAVVLYIVISKRMQDNTTTFLLTYTLLDWVTAFSAWLMSLSRAAQAYALVRSKIADIYGATDQLLYCVATSDCAQAYSVPNGVPDYTSHGCAGTALLAADVVMREAVISGPLLFVLSAQKRWVAAIPLLSLFLASSASAVLHVKNTCEPGAIPEADAVYSGDGWLVFDPVPVDAATARLAWLTNVYALLLILHRLWEDREAIKAYMSDDPIRAGAKWVAWVGVTFAVPAFITETWMTYYDSHEGGRSSDSAVVYAFFALTNSLLIPLMGMYPGLAGLFQRLRRRDVDPDGEVTAWADGKAITPVYPVETKSNVADPSADETL
ncbi:hypothetical protein OH77DRAFT_1515431 [Trametes cingulata]|nr:hypothetical protein OH77DRAFT_1515431 [Trametes cingulata]